MIDKELSYKDRARLERIRGKEGYYKGIPLPKTWNRFRKIIPNIQAKYYLSSADSGVSLITYIIGVCAALTIG